MLPRPITAVREPGRNKFTGRPGPKSGSTVDGSGQQLGRGQTHLVTDPVVAGDRQASLGGGAGVMRGELLGRGQAVFITVVVHGLAAFCAGGSISSFHGWVYSTSLRTFCTWSNWSRSWASCMLISASFSSVCSWAVTAISDSRRYSSLVVSSARVLLLMACCRPHG